MVRVRVGDKSLYETEAPDAIEKFNPREEVRVRDRVMVRGRVRVGDKALSVRKRGDRGCCEEVRVRVYQTLEKRPR
jgi:hypothetical protein